MHKARRGVSPVIATLLLIAVAVALAVVLYTWAVGFATPRPAAPEPAERLKIEAGNLTAPAAGQARAILYVRNIGGAVATVSHAYLLDVRGDAIASSDIPDVSIGPGAVARITATFSAAISRGHTYVVRLTTLRGGDFDIELKAQ